MSFVNTYVMAIDKTCLLEEFKKKIQSLRWKSFEINPSRKVTVGSKFTPELT